jgi:hypothetical protein
VNQSWEPLFFGGKKTGQSSYTNSKGTAPTGVVKKPTGLGAAMAC